jgi:membrane protease YdiL (CAAX protease family)
MPCDASGNDPERRKIFMIETIALPTQAANAAHGVSRRLHGFDLVFIFATALASFIFAFFGVAAASAVYALIVTITGNAIDRALLAANKDLLQTGIVVGALYGMAVAPLGVWGLSQLRGLDWFSLGMRRARHWWWFAIGLAALAAAIAYDLVMAHFLDPDGVIQSEMQKALLVRSDSLAWAIALWVVVAPMTAITEELLFRGLLYRWFRERLPLWIAALASALIFALLHGSLISPGGWMGASMAVGLTLFGVIAALLFEVSGSLWPSILIHFVNNSLFVFGAYNAGGG